MSRKIKALFTLAAALLLPPGVAHAQHVPDAAEEPAKNSAPVDYAFGGGDAAYIAALMHIPGKTDEKQTPGKTLAALQQAGKKTLKGKTVLLGVGPGDALQVEKTLSAQLAHLESFGVADVVLIGDRQPRGAVPAEVMNERYRSLALQRGFTFAGVAPSAEALFKQAEAARAENARINAILEGRLKPGARAIFDMVIGDSIAFTLTERVAISEIKAAGGMPSDIILKFIKNTKPEDLRGKRVLLSTGLSNTPKMLAEAQEQIDLLKAAGARVIVLGVGPNPRFKGLNDKIEKMAKDAGFAFSGPLADTDPVLIHPWDYRIFYRQAARAYVAHYGTIEPGAGAKLKPGIPRLTPPQHPPKPKNKPK